MLGFASFAEVPFAVSKTSAILVLSAADTISLAEAYGTALVTDVSLADNTTYLAEFDGQRGLFFTLSEATDFEDTLPTQVVFAPQVTESTAVFELLPTIATYNVPVTELSSFIDVYPTTAVYNVPLVDVASMYDELFGRKLWEQIDDAENANWTQINSAQANTWSSITTDQVPGWNDITDV